MPMVLRWVEVDECGGAGLKDIDPQAYRTDDAGRVRAYRLEFGTYAKPGDEIFWMHVPMKEIE